MTPSDNKRATPKNLKLNRAATFQQFYAQNYLAIFRFIYGLHGGPTQEVEDLTAETFAKAWKSRNRFSGNEKAAVGWIFKIARNLVIDSYRHHQKRGFHQDIDTLFIRVNSPGPEDQIQANEQVRILWSLLPKLTDQHREILVLRYILGWRVNKIGEHLGLKENTVSVYIRRALQQLRQSWPGNIDEA
jgi:RNA polymerase sigma-70 factor (ECF subfamily)